MKQVLFSACRTYAEIEGVERNFFRNLLSLRHCFQAHGCNYTVSKACQEAAMFAQTPGVPLEIVVSFPINGDRCSADHLHLGTKLIPHAKPAQQFASHFILLTREDKGIARFHHDFDFDIEAPDPKPSPHLQIGGRQKAIRRVEYQVGWDDQLDKPRWPCLPFCTPLMWHAAFLEFRDCESVEPFVDQPWWKNLVIDAEKTLWGSFARDMTLAINRGESIIESLYPPRK